MFDLQALAFASDVTRVFSFKMGRDSSARVFPGSGIDKPFHPASHHGGNEGNITDFSEINRYHVGMLPYFLDRLESTMEGDAHLLDRTMIIYGSPMGDPNIHNHKRCPSSSPEERTAGWTGTCTCVRPPERRWRMSC